MDKWALQRDLYYSIAPQLNSNASHVSLVEEKVGPYVLCQLFMRAPPPTFTLGITSLFNLVYFNMPAFASFSKHNQNIVMPDRN